MTHSCMSCYYTYQIMEFAYQGIHNKSFTYQIMEFAYQGIHNKSFTYQIMELACQGIHNKSFTYQIMELACQGIHNKSFTYQIMSFSYHVILRSYQVIHISNHSHIVSITSSHSHRSHVIILPSMYTLTSMCCCLYTRNHI